VKGFERIPALVRGGCRCLRDWTADQVFSRTQSQVVAFTCKPLNKPICSLEHTIRVETARCNMMIMMGIVDYGRRDARSLVQKMGYRRRR